MNWFKEEDEERGNENENSDENDSSQKPHGDGTAQSVIGGKYNVPEILARNFLLTFDSKQKKFYISLLLR